MDYAEPQIFDDVLDTDYDDDDTQTSSAPRGPRRSKEQRLKIRRELEDYFERKRLMSELLDIDDDDALFDVSLI